MENLKSKWSEILLAVKNEFDISGPSYDTFLSILEPYKIENNTLYILYPKDADQVSLNFIRKQYENPLKFKIMEHLGKDYDLLFILPKDTESITTEPKKDQIQATPNYYQSNLVPIYTFEKFVVGSNNEFAQAASLRVADSPGEVHNPLYLYGGPGLGKTHLMHSIGNYIISRNPNMRVLYVTCEEYTNEVIESIRSTNNTLPMSKLREKYRSVDVLLIDDIQFIIGKEATQNEFFHTFNALRQNGKQIVLSSDRPPKELETLDDRLRSRFEWGLMVDIGIPDYETRMAILKKKAESENFNIDDNILSYIATNIKSNIRELEGALNKLCAYYKLVNIDITLDVAERELAIFISPDKPKEITAQLIIEVVAEHYNVSIEQMISKKRNQEYSKPRQVAMYLCDELTNTNKTNIGNLLGNRDHSTVIHGIENVKKLYTTDPDYKAEIDKIKNKINPS
ncbi:MAG: chromosomal replication initiator protein DnaA [Lachnospiraceae bacterium]|nr:chromosomal replication initiator protein DnaA [Lachnospiraceae bacterium]